MGLPNRTHSDRALQQSQDKGFKKNTSVHMYSSITFSKEELDRALATIPHDMSRQPSHRVSDSPPHVEMTKHVTNTNSPIRVRIKSQRRWSFRDPISRLVLVYDLLKEDA
jgi:hypothetical protein